MGLDRVSFLLIALLFVTAGSGVFAQKTDEKPAPIETKHETEIIIIEKTTSPDGNVTTHQEIIRGDYSDEEIERIIDDNMGEGESERIAVSDADDAGGFLGVYLEGTGGDSVAITGFVDGSPARSSELQKGDVVLSVDGESVSGIEDMVRRISRKKPGETVEIVYSRGGDSGKTRITLARRPGEYALDEQLELEIEEGDHWYDKEHVEKLHRQLERSAGKPRLGINIENAPDGGVRISHVVSGSLAEKAGLRPGDVITSFNKIPVDSTDELIAAVNNAPRGEEVELDYRRAGEKYNAVVTFGE